MQLALLSMPYGSRMQRCMGFQSTNRAQRAMPGAVPQWRGGPGRRAVAGARASSEQDLDRQLLEDLERLKQRQAASSSSRSGSATQQPLQTPASRQVAAPSSSGGSSSSETAGASPLSGLKEGLDKLLIADFFFILAALAWLGAGLAERAVLHSTGLLDTWLNLWQLVFQPAIGVLMLGALVSGAVGWAKENLGGGK